MKTLEELRRIDEGRPVARLAKFVEGCARIAVVGGGALLVVAFATAHWQSWTSALVFKRAGGLCAGGIGAYCVSALLHNPRRRRGAASPMRRANTGREGARRARRATVQAAPMRKRPRRSGPAARADRYRMELKRDRPLRAIHLVGVFGMAGFAVVAALLKGTSSGWENSLYTSLSVACLFGMIVCLTLALLPTALRIGRLIGARGRRPRRVAALAEPDATRPRRVAALAEPDATRPRRVATPKEPDATRPRRETELDGPSEAQRRSAPIPTDPAEPSEDNRRAESYAHWPWKDAPGGHRPSDKDAPHLMRLVGLLVGVSSVLVGALLRGMADGSTYLLFSLVSHACLVGLVVSAGLVVFPGFAARCMARFRTRRHGAGAQHQGAGKSTP